MNRRIFTSLLGALLSSAALPAFGQAGRELDRLLSSAPGQTTRAVMRGTRATKRYAVVIGCSGYTSIPTLPNAHADAAVMARFFKEQGYQVNTHLDITKRGFEDTLRRVLFDVDKDTEVVVFFAGHGFQIGSENYLVPVDADLNSVYDVPFEAVSLGSLLAIVGARARLQVVILDSCRDNPFAGKTAVTRISNELREARTGFSSQAAPLNSMMIFSTAPGSVAFDGNGDNSPFTAALIGEVSQQPDAMVKDIFVGVRRAVYEKTDGRQVPWDSSTLVEDVSFGLNSQLSEPILVASAGIGVTRGLARIVDAPTVVPVKAEAPVSAALEVDFLPEVEIGFALRDALDLTPADTVRITQAPRTGRLVKPDASGFQRDVEGDDLGVAQVDQLLLINNSVQIPAVSLENGVIEDQIELEVGGIAQTVVLRLLPDPCDFEAGDHLDPDGMGLTRFANEIRPEIALAACDAAVARDPENGRFHYQRGRALTALRRFDEATDAMRRARDLGHARALHGLATALHNETRRTGGESEIKASDEVLGLFAQGVEQGDPYAFYALGRQFMRHGGTNAIEIEGYDLMMRSLEVGHTFAMNELGFFYLDASNAYNDPERGLRYLRESAARGDIYGFNNMGLVYLQGLGGAEIDLPAAFDMFEKATAGGHPSGPFNLGRMYRDGQVTGAPDLVLAVKWFAEGLERGDPWAGGNAAFLVATNPIAGYDSFDAAILGAKSAVLGNERAAAQARGLIAGFDAVTLNGGTQRMINQLGGDVPVDGDFGLQSDAALTQVLMAHDADSAPADPLERALHVARVVWTTSPFRVDLY